MPELVLTTLKFLFLGLLYLFVARALRVIWLDLAGPRQVKAKLARGGVISVGPAPARRGARRGGRVAALSVTEDGAKARTHPLSGEPITMGRSDKCSIPLHDTYVSQMHTRFFVKDGTWFVEDLGSTNGTYLNGIKVADPMPVEPGDEVRLGKTIARVTGR